MASCQAAKLPLAVIFWGMLPICGVTTTTLKEGFANA
jgi:hypothetical protein